MASQHILLVLADTKTASALDRNVLRPAGYQVTWLDNLHTAENLVNELQPDVVVLGDRLIDGSFTNLTGVLASRFPTLPVILFPGQADPALVVQALRHGCTDCLLPPQSKEQVLEAVKRALDKRTQMEAWTQVETARTTDRLRRRVDELETLTQIGRAVTANLDLDRVLTTIVDAAVELTGAEEGTLLLVDEASGELYMRAARNFQDDFVRTFRLPIQDSLAGQVVATGAPVVLDEETPQKIKTAYLVQALLYVPLKIGGRVIGVLGVDNRTGASLFLDHHLVLMSAFADYAAIAIENARLFADTEIERDKLETILTQIEDAVIVIDNEARFLLLNRAARQVFQLGELTLRGKLLSAVPPHTPLAKVLQQTAEKSLFPMEVKISDGRVFNAQLVNIPDVGRALTLQDVTHFKELDAIKNEFVSTVSHDLRSPLTSILGYVNLVERSGEMNELQLEYIQRVETSVKTITELIDKLLDLGQIEAGFDRQLERVSLPGILNEAVEGQRHPVSVKNQKVILAYPDDLPLILGNPLRLRQLFDNLIDNAIKYTPVDGEIKIGARVENKQLILQVQDSGVGIPPADQPYIFDKLFRASNVPKGSRGSGLGLSIVKSIVESHKGRIWAKSTPGQGSTFTVVFPIVSRAQQS
jgi:two-component system NtrC family sensor kinase